MLILSRKEQEVICIGDDIRVVVTRTGPTQVSLGIEAPSEVSVHREEIYRRIKKKPYLEVVPA